MTQNYKTRSSTFKQYFEDQRIDVNFSWQTLHDNIPSEYKRTIIETYYIKQVEPFNLINVIQ